MGPFAALDSTSRSLWSTEAPRRGETTAEAPTAVEGLTRGIFFGVLERREFSLIVGKLAFVECIVFKIS